SGRRTGLLHFFVLLGRGQNAGHAKRNADRHGGENGGRHRARQRLFVRRNSNFFRVIGTWHFWAIFWVIEEQDIRCNARVQKDQTKGMSRARAKASADEPDACLLTFPAPTRKASAWSGQPQRHYASAPAGLAALLGCRFDPWLSLRKWIRPPC